MTKHRDKNGNYKSGVGTNNTTSNDNKTIKLQNSKETTNFSSYNPTFIKAFKNYLINKNKAKNENEYNSKR